MEPGVFKAVDPQSLEKLENEHQQRIDESKSKAKIWAKHREEYRSLQQKLSTITDKTQHDVMVPFGGKKAFFEGQLIHTNEIMVLLGDNWFVERSAKEAREICQRRIQRCDEMLEKLDQEVRLYQSWLDEAQQLGRDSEKGEGNLEIREPFDQEAEAKWRIEHKERVKKEKMKTSEKTRENEDDEAFWRRLDELEIEEELDAHLESQKNEHDEENFEDEEGNEEESDLSESPPLTDDSDGEEDIIKEIKETLQAQKNNQSKSISFDENFMKNSGEETKEEAETNRRSVSFGDVSERLFSREQDDGIIKDDPPSTSTNLNDLKAEEGQHTKIIEFSNTPVQKIEVQVIPDPGEMPKHPGDLVKLYGHHHNDQIISSSSPDKPGTPKKSILKSDSKYGPLSAESFIASSPGVKTKKKKGVKMMSFASDVSEIPPSGAAATSTPNPIQAVSDVVIERKTTQPLDSGSNKNNSSEASKNAPVTQVFSRFRATRVHQ